jgi:hypothetical protein
LCDVEAPKFSRRLTDGVEVVSLMHRPPFTLRKILDTYFLPCSLHKADSLEQVVVMVVGLQTHRFLRLFSLIKHLANSGKYKVRAQAVLTETFNDLLHAYQEMFVTIF